MSLVVTGNPGVGKHTISKNLANTLQYDLIDINTEAIKSGLFKKTKDALDVDVSKLKKVLKAKVKKRTLVVGHLAPYVLTKSQISNAIILRRSPYDLISVYKKRRYSMRKMQENLQAEILGVVAYDTLAKFGQKCIQIDCTSKSIHQVVRKIKKALAGNVESEFVDWLSLVVEKKDLKKFFPN